MMDTPIALRDVTDDVIEMMAEEFATQATARMMVENKRVNGPTADTGPEITEILMQMNNAAFAAGFKVAKRIHDAESEH